MSTMAHFIITGDFIAKMARDLMLSDEPGRAYRLIADCLTGEGIDTVARKVLAGTVTLAGDSANGVNVVELHDSDSLREYMKQLRYIYAGRVRLQGRWYRPRGVVESYGPEDAHAAGRAPTRLGGSYSTWCRERAKFYAGDGETVELVRVADSEYGIYGEHYVVFEACAEPPQWLTPASDAQAAVDDALAVGRRLATLGAHLIPRVEAERLIDRDELEPSEADNLRDIALAAEDEMREAALDKIAADVRERAGDDVFALTLLDGRVVQVPRAPFAHWALSRLPDSRPDMLPPWVCVSQKGVKMEGDDPYHTDWVLGSGLTVEEGYSDNVTSPAWDLVIDMQIAEVDRA